MEAMQDTEGAKANSGLWLIVFAAVAAFASCVLIVVLVIYCHKKQQTPSQLLCVTLGCVTARRKYPNIFLVHEILIEMYFGAPCRIHVVR